MPTPEDYLKMKRKELLAGRMKPAQQDSFYRPYERAQQQPSPRVQERAMMPKIRPDQAYAAYQRPQQQLQRRPLDIPEQPRGAIFPSQANIARMQSEVQAYAAGQDPEEERLKRLLQITRYGSYA